jgi:hypothetical protein
VDHAAQAGVFLVPAAAQLVQAVDAVAAGPRVGREAAAVHPDGPGLDGDDPFGGVGEQLPVMGDQQDGFGVARNRSSSHYLPGTSR